MSSTPQFEHRLKGKFELDEMVEYRAWLNKHVGRQGRVWNWKVEEIYDIGRDAKIRTLILTFKEEKYAILFALKFKL